MFEGSWNLSSKEGPWFWEGGPKEGVHVWMKENTGDPTWSPWVKAEVIKVDNPNVVVQYMSQSTRPKIQKKKELGPYEFNTCKPYVNDQDSHYGHPQDMSEQAQEQLYNLIHNQKILKKVAAPAVVGIALGTGAYLGRKKIAKTLRKIIGGGRKKYTRKKRTNNKRRRTKRSTIRRTKRKKRRSKRRSK